MLSVTGSGFNVTSPAYNSLYWLKDDGSFAESVYATVVNSVHLEFYSTTNTKVKAGTQSAQVYVQDIGFSDVFSVNLGSASASITSFTPTQTSLGGEPTEQNNRFKNAFIYVCCFSSSQQPTAFFSF